MRFHGIDLNQLVSLDALLTERNVTRAAERVFLSQSAMSWSLARLRDHFGDQLLISSGRKMVLTPFAQSLVEPLRDLLLRIQAVTSRRTDVPLAQIQRVLRIVASDYVAITVLSSVMQRIEHEAPGLRLDLRSLIDFEPEWFESGEVDLLISADSALLDNHPREHLLEDEYVAIAWRENRDISEKITIDQYQDLGHVATQWRGGRVVTLDQSALRDLRMVQRNQIIVPDFTLMPSFIIGTSRIATIQRRLARIFEQQWPIKIADLPITLPPITISTQWHSSRDDDPVILWIRKILREVSDDWSKILRVTAEI